MCCFVSYCQRMHCIFLSPPSPVSLYYVSAALASLSLALYHSLVSLSLLLCNYLLRLRQERFCSRNGLLRSSSKMTVTLSRSRRRSAIRGGGRRRWCRVLDIRDRSWWFRLTIRCRLCFQCSRVDSGHEVLLLHSKKRGKFRELFLCDLCGCFVLREIADTRISAIGEKNCRAGYIS